MNYKRVSDFLAMLESHNLIIEYNLAQETLDREVKYISYNSMDVKANTLFVCKGVHFKNEYLQYILKWILLMVNQILLIIMK